MEIFMSNNVLKIEAAQVPEFSNCEIVRLLRSAVREFNQAIQILDSGQQSETAGRLHALSVELRELASVTETVEIDEALNASRQSRYLQ
jgi:hypothetical protein